MPVLIAALYQTVKRHQALQTRFAVKDGRAEQVFALPEAIHLPVVDLQGLTENRPGSLIWFLTPKMLRQLGKSH